MIRLYVSTGGYYMLINESTDEELFIATDWDFPGLATHFGWEACPFCRETDGTIDCKHRSASAMIQSAVNFLDDHNGATIKDPGYFT